MTTKSQFALDDSVSSRTGSAISVVNAIATGMGSAIGIDLECKVKATIVKRDKGSKSSIKRGIVVQSDLDDHHDLVRTSAELALKRLGASIPKDSAIYIAIDSKIPQAVGLKSSSAVSTAVVESIFKLTGREKTDPGVLLNVSCTASKSSGASLTGAYDDASACLLGGLVLADNSNFRIIKHLRIPGGLGRNVLVFLPDGGNKKRFTSDVKRSDYKGFQDQCAKAFEYALVGNVPSAMLLNSLVQCATLNYSFQPISAALEAGASACGVTGKGPAVAALCVGGKDVARIKSAWLDSEPRCKIIETKVVEKKMMKKKEER